MWNKAKDYINCLINLIEGIVIVIKIKKTKIQFIYN